MTAVLFDLDGVLVDSEPFWQSGFAETVNAHACKAGWRDPRLTADAMEEYQGGRVKDTVASILRAIGHASAAADPVLVRALTGRVIDHACEAFIAHPRPIGSSVRAALDLHDAGVVLGLASNSSERFMRVAIERIGLDGVFVAQQSAFRLRHAKPEPRIYELIVGKLGVEASSCVAIEDSRSGVESATRAGVRCVGLWRGGGIPPDYFDDCVAVSRRLTAAQVLRARPD